MTVTFGSSVDIADSDGYLSDQFLLITVEYSCTEYICRSVVYRMFCFLHHVLLLACKVQDVITRTFCSDDGSRLAISVHSLS